MRHPSRRVRRDIPANLCEKQLVADAFFLVDSAPRVRQLFQRHGLQLQHETLGDRDAAERVFPKFKRRTTGSFHYFSLFTPRQSIPRPELWSLSQSAYVELNSREARKV